MTYEELKEGFALGRQLVQEKRGVGNPIEEAAADQLIEFGLARTDGWFYCRAGDCEIRLVVGIKQ